MAYLPTHEEVRVISFVVQGLGGLKQALEHFAFEETDWIRGWRRGAVYGDTAEAEVPSEVTNPEAFQDGRERGLRYRTTGER